MWLAALMKLSSSQNGGGVLCVSGVGFAFETLQDWCSYMMVFQGEIMLEQQPAWLMAWLQNGLVFCGVQV